MPYEMLNIPNAPLVANYKIDIFAPPDKVWNCLRRVRPVDQLAARCQQRLLGVRSGNRRQPEVAAAKGSWLHIESGGLESRA
jgi:hypothetical protein